MKFFRELRVNELLAMCYRLLLAFFFYQIARLLFWFFNRNEISVDGISEYLKLAFYGTAFDTTAILYVNALFILLSVIPIIINSTKIYHKVLFWIYFITNGIAYAMNFGDFIYYRFSKARLTTVAFDVAENENNLSKVFFHAVVDHPFVILWYILLMILWVFLYKKVNVKESRPVKLVPYFIASVLTLCAVVALTVGGIRGDFKHSTRPINMVDAGKHVQRPEQANIVLNSTFSFFRTLGKNTFKLVNFVDEKFINENVHPFKQYNREVATKPNIVILIVESFGREYSGAFNKNLGIQNYESFTPFVDSLAQESLIFTNAYANGRQSIHGMSSILAGIPSLIEAFTSSPYANQDVQSIVSIANEMGYDTSFYHGAPNGSMGFQGFAGILGFNHYYGKDEFNNDDEFDGMWAIWDEPFLQYFAKSQPKNKPFMTTVITASSHHPFQIPKKYKGKFKKGHVEIHEPLQYTDYALKKYFDEAKKLSWYHNTIFVITADHTNQNYYKQYTKGMNRFAVPIILFSPNPEYQLKGVNTDFAQQIDVFPTLVDLMGYKKQFRSWGRSLVSEKKEPYLIVNSDGVVNNVITGNYIYNFDGRNITAVFTKDDIDMEKNLINQATTKDMEHGKQIVKGWYQDYMDRIINRKLN